MIDFLINHPIELSAFIDLLNRSGLAQRRPVQDERVMQGMLEHANLLVSAWHGSRLVGMARSVTDFHYACYLSDLAVDRPLQRQGIGKQMVRITQQHLYPTCKLVLVSSADADHYYPKLGFVRSHHAWQLPRGHHVNTG